MKVLATDIDRHDWGSLGRDRFEREYLLPLRPVVIRGAIEHWAARNKWTPDFFIRHHGSRQVFVDGMRWRLGELIARITQSTPDHPAPYLHNQLIERLEPSLLADVSPMPECTRPNWLQYGSIPSRLPLTYIELNIGGAGARFPVLHYDNLHTHAFLMQLHGEKEYLALAPDQTEFVYPHSGIDANKSSIDDPEKPDKARFPLFNQATGIRFRLNAGETLFVPAGWWHTARILSTSITVSVNGANRANWTAFRRDYAAHYGGLSRWRAALLRPYLGALGVALALKDLCETHLANLPFIG